MSKTYFKIVDFADGIGCRFIHFGLNGSKKIEFSKWLKAEKKKVIDGSGGTEYESGFHVFKTEDDAAKYMKLFKKNKHLKCIAAVKVKGIRKKRHSRADVLLVDQIYFMGV